MRAFLHLHRNGVESEIRMIERTCKLINVGVGKMNDNCMIPAMSMYIKIQMVDVSGGVMETARLYALPKPPTPCMSLPWAPRSLTHSHPLIRVRKPFQSFSGSPENIWERTCVPSLHAIVK